MSSINSLSQNYMTRGHMRTMQDAMGELQRKISSGYNSQSYGGYGATDGVTVVDLRNDVKRLESYQKTITVLDARAERVDIAYGRMSELGSAIRNDALKLSVRGIEPSLLQNSAKVALSQAIDQLNSQVSGHFVFSGQAAGQPAIIDFQQLQTNFTTSMANEIAMNPPLRDDPAAFMATAQAWFADTTNWYTGGPASSSINIGDNRKVTPEGQGDAPEIGGFLASMAVIAFTSFDPAAPATADFSTRLNYEQLIEDATTRLGSAVDLTEASRSRNGALRASMESQSTIYADLLLSFGQSLNDIEQVDMPEAIARLNQYQSTLQATYKVESEMRQLSLAMFL